jgi:ribonuclease P protein subunit POP4
MKITPDIIRGELIGLGAKVAKSTNPSLVRLKGTVLNETRNTIVLLSDGKEKSVVKDTSIFHFTLQDGAVLEIDGKLLVGRPEDRVRKRVRRLW